MLLFLKTDGNLLLGDLAVFTKTVYNDDVYDRRIIR